MATKTHTAVPPRQVGELSPEVQDLLERWQQLGLLSAAEVSRIRAVETGAEPITAPEAGRSTVVAEALGYLGAALVAAALSLLVGRFWDGMPLLTRETLAAAMTVVTLGGGLLVPLRKGPPARRLRAVFWMLSVAFLAATLGLAAGQGWDWRGQDAVVFAAGVAACYGAVLWWRCREVPLHVGVFGAAMVSAAAAGNHLTALSDQGVPTALWLAAVGWVLLTWLGLVRPATLGAFLGAVVALAASVALQQAAWGHAIALLTVAAILGFAVGVRSLRFLVLGAVGAFVTVTQFMDDLIPGPIGAAVGLLAVGLGIAAIGVVVFRKHGE